MHALAVSPLKKRAEASSTETRLRPGRHRHAARERELGLAAVLHFNRHADVGIDVLDLVERRELLDRLVVQVDLAAALSGDAWPPRAPGAAPNPRRPPRPRAAPPAMQPRQILPRA